MPAFVVDASAIVAVLVEEQDGIRVERALQEVQRQQGELHSPDLIAYEVANALWKRTKRGDIDADLATERMSDFGALEIRLHAAPSIARVALGLALGHDLTAYDAAYLSVALTLGAPLLTLDQRLRERSLAAGVASPAL